MQYNYNHFECCKLFLNDNIFRQYYFYMIIYDITIIIYIWNYKERNLMYLGNLRCTINDTFFILRGICNYLKRTFCAISVLQRGQFCNGFPLLFSQIIQQQTCPHGKKMISHWKIKRRIAWDVEKLTRSRT